ncbi:MAG: HAD hydrolase family protein [Eubacteriales bacterium]|nr:HAD hydrolase family protein [Eubacteriales bacterium]
MLYISDLDGTLLGDNTHPSAQSVRLLNELTDAGVRFTVASARNLLAMKEILAGLRLRLPVVELNGAFLTDPVTGEHVMENTLSHELALSLLADMTALGVTPCLNTWASGPRLYYGPGNNPAIRQFIGIREKQHDPRLRKCTDLSVPAGREAVVCYSLLDEEEKVTALYEAWKTRYAGLISPVLYRDVLVPGYRQLSVYAYAAQKSTALAEYARVGGFSPGQVTVFGDDVNDLPMFAWAGRAIAMGNAIDEVKAAADLVIGSNTQSSVARFIYEEFFGRPAPG